ncbi:MAG: MgtC/SapB family protein, partial [Muribaculaceae bacterium]|nr:MgtC/SapB family protein [Muribaculaceae bacterium]
MKGAVRGLTTAAGIWMTAIIGMAVGVGMYMCSIGATILILLTLVAFEHYEKRRKLGQESKVVSVTVWSVVENIERYREVFRDNRVHLSTFYVEYDYEKGETEINFVILAHAYTDLLSVMSQVSKVYPTKSLTLSSQLDI